MAAPTSSPLTRALRWSAALVVVTASAIGLLLVSAYVEARRVWPSQDVAPVRVEFQASERATEALTRAAGLVSTVAAMEQAARAEGQDPDARTHADREALRRTVTEWIAADGEARVEGEGVSTGAARAVPAYFLGRGRAARATDQAVEQLTTALATAARLQRSGPALALLVAGADMTGEAAHALTGRLAASPSDLSDGALEALARVLAPAGDDAGAAAALAAECERFEKGLRSARPRVSTFQRYDPAATVAVVHARCAAAVEAIDAPAHARRLPVFPRLSADGIASLAVGLDNGVGRAALDRFAFEPLLRAAAAADRAEAARGLLAVHVALVRAFRRDGAYPEQLDALVPDFLAAVPVDPTTGEPPRWRPGTRELSTKAVRGSVRLAGG